MTERIARACVCCGSAALTRSPAVLMPFVAERVFGWSPVEITPEWGLRTLQTGMAYSLCNSLECQDCGLVFLDIRFSDEEAARLYADYRGEAYTAQRERFEPGYARLNAAMLASPSDTGPAEAFLRPHLRLARPRVLDWGGDTGAATPFRDDAASIDILDISERPLRDGARRVREADLTPGEHDLVVLSHVLEHVPYPAQLLRQVVGQMGPDTLLYIETPYEQLIAQAETPRGLNARKRYWHEHINFFTQAAMRRLLQGCGLEVEALEVRDLESLANISQALAVACRRARPA